jgi:hypothetical protein
MNPSFQTAGGAWKLLWSAQQPSYAGQGLSAAAVGWLLIIGAVGTGIASVGLLATMGSMGGPSALLSAFTGGYNNSGYDPYAGYETATEAPAEAPADPYYAEAAPPPASYSTYGAYAISESTLAWGAAWSASSRESAESSANSQCGQSDCRAYSFQDMCGAIAIDGNSRMWAIDWGYSVDEASSKAMTACGQYGSSTCQIQHSICSGG